MDRATSIYELCEPVRGRRGLVGNLLMIFDAWTGGGGTDAVYEHQVRDRRTGAVVYSVTTVSGLDYNEARRSISEDLEKLSVESFQWEYGMIPRKVQES